MRVVLRGDGVLVHAVQEALDHAEGDQPADVDPFEGGAVVDAEALDALALAQRAVEFDQVRRGGSGGGGVAAAAVAAIIVVFLLVVLMVVVRNGYVSRALVLHFQARDEGS